jgi:hypothetical protein
MASADSAGAFFACFSRLFEKMFGTCCVETECGRVASGKGIFSSLFFLGGDIFLFFFFLVTVH